eukprot:c30822_g1_i1 orf=1-210(-)
MIPRCKRSKTCVGWWNMMHSPLHAIGYILHHFWRVKEQDNNSKLHEGWITMLETYTKGDVDLQGILIDDP